MLKLHDSICYNRKNVFPCNFAGEGMESNTHVEPQDSVEESNVLHFGYYAKDCNNLGCEDKGMTVLLFDNDMRSLHTKKMEGIPNFVDLMDEIVVNI